MQILVTGGTGTVGSEVVRQLAGTPHDVKVLTRDASKASTLPAGVEAVTGNLLDQGTVRRVFEGIDAVFLINALGQAEANEGLMAVAGMRLAGVKRVVYVSVQHVDAAPWLPHFGSKIGVELAVQRSGIPFTILRPNNFFQNDYWFRDVILQHGIYPQPIGDVGLSRVDVRDIGEAAAVCLTTPDHEGEVYDLVGPRVETGESTARAWSEALGRPVSYGGNDLDAWERQAVQMLPDWLAFDFRLMYDFFQKNGLRASPEAIERQTRLTGHPPRPFDAFARETAAAWAGTA